MSEIPLCVPELGGNEWLYLKECLDTNFVSSVGPFVSRFEREMAAVAGARHGVATVNGTAALHVALLAVGIEPDDEVLVSTLTFIAPVNAIRYAGAWPVFIDAEPAYWQMDPQRVSDFLERDCDWIDGHLRNRRTGRRVRGILPVDILGHPVDMDPIAALARKFGLALVEDASESLGALYKGEPVGRRSDIACLSFNGNKVITTGGGGMMLTDNAAWARHAKSLTTQAKRDAIEFVHDEVAYNYRLTNLLAALGVAQLERLDGYVATKRRLARRYADALQDVPGITFMKEAEWATSAFWLSTVLVDPGDYGMTNRVLLQRLAALGIQTRPLWQPNHQSAAHRDAPPAQCPVSERLNDRALSLPSSVGLTDEDQQRVIDAIRSNARA